MASIKFNKTQTDNLSVLNHGRFDCEYDDLHKKTPTAVKEFIDCLSAVFGDNDRRHSELYYYNNKLRLTVYDPRNYWVHTGSGLATAKLVIEFLFNDTGYTVDVTNTINPQSIVAKVNKIIPNYCELDGNTLRVNGFAHIEMKLLIAAFRRYNDVYKVCVHNNETYGSVRRHVVEPNTEEYNSLIDGVNTIIKQMNATNAKLLGKKVPDYLKVVLNSITCVASMFGKTFYDVAVGIENRKTYTRTVEIINVVVENGVAAWCMKFTDKSDVVFVLLKNDPSYEFMQRDGKVLCDHINMKLDIEHCWLHPVDAVATNKYEELVVEAKKTYDVISAFDAVLKKFKK